MSTQKLTQAFLALLVLTLWPAWGAAQDQAQVDVSDGAKVTITEVVSGHELQGKLEDGTQVTIRVMGIDCPGGKPGKRATKVAKKLIQKKLVTLESTHESFPLLQDNNGRLVAYVRTNGGKDLATTMLENGQCTTAMWKLRHPRQIAYAQLGN